MALLAEFRLPGLVVTDTAGRPLRMTDQMADRLRGKTVGALLPDHPSKPTVVRHDDTIVDIAAVMHRLHCPLVAVMRNARWSV